MQSFALSFIFGTPWIFVKTDEPSRDWWNRLTVTLWFSSGESRFNWCPIMDHFKNKLNLSTNMYSLPLKAQPWENHWLNAQRAEFHTFDMHFMSLYVALHRNIWWTSMSLNKHVFRSRTVKRQKTYVEADTKKNTCLIKDGNSILSWRRPSRLAFV